MQQTIDPTVAWLLVLLAGNFIAVIFFGVLQYVMQKGIESQQYLLQQQIDELKPKRRVRKKAVGKQPAAKAKKPTPKNPLAAAVEQSG